MALLFFLFILLGSPELLLTASSDLPLAESQLEEEEELEQELEKQQPYLSDKKKVPPQALW